MSVRIRLASGVRWSGPAIVAIVAAVVVVSVGVAGLIRVGSALLTPAADPGTEKVFDDLYAMHDQSSAVNRARFEGRSIFFMPVPPPPPPPLPPPPPPPGDDKDPGPPPPPPPPTEYSGTKVMACIGGTVYFVDGTQLAVGEDKGGIRVVSTDPPWTVTLHHLSKSYLVSTLPDSTESFFGGSTIGFGPANAGMELVSNPRVGAPKTPVPPGSPELAPAGNAPPIVRTPDGRSLPVESEAGDADDKPESEADSPTPPDAAPEAASDEGETAPPAPEIPAALTREQIDQMDRTAATQAFQSVARARLNRTLDAATRTRLNQEYSWLQSRIKALPR